MEKTLRPADCAAVSKQAVGMLKLLDSLLKNGEGEKKRKAETLRSHYKRTVKAALRDIRPGKNALFWFLSSEQTRKKTCASCNYLYDVLYLGLGPELRELLK